MAPFLMIFYTLFQNEMIRLNNENKSHLTLLAKWNRRELDEVAHFLTNIKLDHLLPNFEKEGIMPEMFNYITIEMLKNAGITKSGDQFKILKHAQDYTSSLKCLTVVELERKMEHMRINHEKELEDEVNRHDAEVQEYKARITKLEEEVNQLKLQNGPTKHIIRECPKCKEKHKECVHADTSLCSNTIRNSPNVSLSRRTSMITSNNNNDSLEVSRSRRNTAK